MDFKNLLAYQKAFDFAMKFLSFLNLFQRKKRIRLKTK